MQAFEARYGRAAGRKAWLGFRSKNDPEAPTTISRRFPYETRSAFAKRGLALPDPGSVREAPTASASASRADRAAAVRAGASSLGRAIEQALRGTAHSSNWELVSAKHSATGHPIAVMGPQVGYYIPQILMEEDLHGPGIDARGASFAGVNLVVELGHGRDYAWSATSADSDNVDTFAEVLCRDKFHYLYRGKCMPMEKLVRIDSWTPNAIDETAAGSQTLTAYRTVHGIVFARGKVHGKKVAFVHQRSTYFHEADSIIGFSQLNEPEFMRNAAQFKKAVSHINFVFNWAYVDSKHIAYAMSGAMPQRAKGTSPDFPILGTGQYDWKGFDPKTHTADWLPFSKHPQAVDPDFMVSWNNKQAPGWAAADNNYGYGPIFRSQMISDKVRAATKGNRKMTITQLIQAMEEPATQDLPAYRLLPTIFKAIGKPKQASLRQALAELRTWQQGRRPSSRPQSRRGRRRNSGDRADGRLVAEAGQRRVRTLAGQQGLRGAPGHDRDRLLHGRIADGTGFRGRLVGLCLQGPPRPLRSDPEGRLQPGLLRQRLESALPGGPSEEPRRRPQGDAGGTVWRRRRDLRGQPAAILLRRQSAQRDLRRQPGRLPVPEPADLPAGGDPDPAARALRASAGIAGRPAGL